MSSTTPPPPAIATIATMMTPALLILASASLVASALVQLGRAVDRARVFAAAAEDGTWARVAPTPALLRTWLNRHAVRARYAARSIQLLYVTVVVFVATSLSTVLAGAARADLAWLPTSLAILGVLFLLAGSGYMVAESRLTGSQVQEEIRHAHGRLEAHGR